MKTIVDIQKDFPDWPGGVIQPWLIEFANDPDMGWSPPELYGDYRWEGYGIARKEERVNVKIKWHGGVAQFAYPIHGIEASGHANFHHALSKRADVRNNVNVSRTRSL